MRKEYRKAARKLFAEALADAAPEFAVEKVRSQVLWNGETVFRWRDGDELEGFRGYALLSPSPTGRQAFTVQLAWSIHDRFPEVTANPSHMMGPGDPPPVDVPEGIVRLGGVIDGKDRWWTLPDPAVERPGDIAALQKSLEPIEPPDAEATVAPRVREAVAALCTAGVPFLESLWAHHVSNS